MTDYKLPEPIEKKLTSLGLYYQELSVNEILCKILPEFQPLQYLDFDYLDRLCQRQLKVENFVFLHCNFALKTAIDHGFLRTNKEGKDTLDRLIDNESLGNDILDKIRQTHSEGYYKVFGIYFDKLFDPYFSLIDVYIDKIVQNINENPNYFIEHVNKVSLGNFFKCQLLGTEELVQQTYAHNIKNRNLIKESLVNPNGITSAPLIAEQIASHKKIVIPEHQLDFFDMDEIELIDLKNTIDHEIVSAIDQTYANDSDYIKHCFKFRGKNTKGLATILYGLYQIVLPREFLSKEELEKANENTSVIVDSRYWAKYKERQILKRVDYGIVFS